MKNLLFKFCLLILTLIQVVLAINARQACRPPVPQTSQEPNIFTEEQEVDLGDAIAEHIQRNFRVIGVSSKRS